MDITKLNFNERLTELTEVIENATFFAIDGEFTGLPNADVSAFDKLSEFYIKTKQSTEDYVIVQMGFTAFRLSTAQNTTDEDSFTYRSYNFYIYPQGRHQRFTCQGGSMQFLAMHNFDFNKLFQHGISYCDRDEEEDFLQKFNERKKWFLEKGNQNDDESTDFCLKVPDDECEKLDRIREYIEEFLRSSDTEKIIGNLNGFQRRLVYQLIDTSFSDRISATSRLINTNKKVIVIERKKSLKKEKEQLREKLEQEETLLNERIGFRKFITLLSKSKKLIIGHNMLLDVMYMMRQFFVPLPTSLKDFKIITHRTFPNLLDTKYLCQSDNLKDKVNSSVLTALYETILQKPFQLPPISPDSSDYSYSSDNPKEHEAGYDSYITGLSFIALAAHLQILPKDMNEKSQKLRGYLNRLCVYRLVNNTFINLAGKEPEPNRDHVFHITVPPNWILSNVIHHFRNFGSVYVSWIGTNTAYLSLNQREHAAILIKSIDKPDGFYIQSYNDYHRGKESDHKNVDEHHPKTILKRTISNDTQEPNTKKQKRKIDNVDFGASTSAVSTKNRLFDIKPFKENDDW